MKQTKLALSAVMIVAVGLIGTNFVTGLDMTGQEKFDALSNSNVVYGHLTIVHSDPDGNILAYIQTDNQISSFGLDCMAPLVFGNTEGDSSCESAGTSNFTKIALYKDESFPNIMNATAGGGGGNDLLTTDLTVDGLEIGNGTLTVSEDAVAVATVNADKTGIDSGTKTDIQRVFTAGSLLSSQIVNGAALFNFDQDAVLAGQTFSPVTLDVDDTLTITWTIEIG